MGSVGMLLDSTKPLSEPLSEPLPADSPILSLCKRSFYCCPACSTANIVLVYYNVIEFSFSVCCVTAIPRLLIALPLWCLATADDCRLVWFCFHGFCPLLSCLVVATAARPLLDVTHPLSFRLTMMPHCLQMQTVQAAQHLPVPDAWIL